jgi:hypothetical protein
MLFHRKGGGPQWTRLGLFVTGLMVSTALAEEFHR